MNLCPPGLQVFRWGRSKFFMKFAEIFVHECLSPVSTTLAISCSPINDTCDKFSMIPGVVDTCGKFLTGVTVNNFVDDNGTANKFIASDKNKDAMEVGSCQG